MADEEDKLRTGRFARLAKLATLSARLSTDVGSRVVKRLVSAENEESSSLLGPGAAEKLVGTLGELKGLAMKVGQGLSMDPDLLTPEIRAVVARLQNQAPPMSWAAVSSVLLQDFGRPPDEVFHSFERAPVASASLGQVHRAVTKDGHVVAVKVQYPDIAKALESDLQNVGTMVKVVSTTSRLTHATEYFKEVQQGLLDELDYRVEAERSRTFAQAARPFPDLRVPRVYDELTTARVLTLEFFDGMTVKEFLANLETHSRQERFHLSRLLVRAMWGPLLCSGIVHCDPHPGNFMLMNDGTLGVLDFGSIKQVGDRWADANRRLIDSHFGGPPYSALDESTRAGMTFQDPVAAKPFVEKVLSIACRALTRETFDYATAGLNRELRNLFMRNALIVKNVRPPKEALQFFRAVAGTSQNLESLKAQGPFRAVFEELHTVVRETRGS